MSNETKSRAGGRDWRDDPMLGTTPSATVSALLSELLERVRAARDLPDALEKLRPLDPSVFERAWVNELFVILDGVQWMFDIVRILHERAAGSTRKKLEPLPRSFKEAKMREVEGELKPARDVLVAHYFGNLRGGLTVREYFKVAVGQCTLRHAHDAIQSSIEALWEWREKNQVLVEDHLTARDLKGKRKGTRKGKP